MDGIRASFATRMPRGAISQMIKTQFMKMDKYFHWTIKDADRNLGEYELKQHGFEYRSLPCNVDVYEVLKKGFEILFKKTLATFHNSLKSSNNDDGLLSMNQL